MLPFSEDAGPISKLRRELRRAREVILRLPAEIADVSLTGFARSACSLGLTAVQSIPKFQGPVLVLGSGPGGRKPAGAPNGWSLATVNGSWAMARTWGWEHPDITLLGPALFKENPVSQIAMDILRGQSTRHLVSISAAHKYFFIQDKARQIGLGFETLSIAHRLLRRWVIAKAVGDAYAHGGNPSSGVLLALLCLNGGASEVVMSGFSLTQAGHAYNAFNFPRVHVDADRRILRAVAQRGLPVVTNDPTFAAESGLRLRSDD